MYDAISCFIYATWYILQDVADWIDRPRSDLLEEHNLFVPKAQVSKAGCCLGAAGPQ